MTTYSLNEAKTHLSRLLEAVRRGEEITITRYGVPVARLVPATAPAGRELGFYPIVFQSDLTEQADPETVAGFYEAA